MGVPSGPRQVLEWEATLGGMVKHGARVRWSCPACRGWGDVDLAPLVAELGQRGSLWDRHPPCKTPGCPGKVSFLASPAAGTPYRPLISTGRPVRRPVRLPRAR